MFLLVKKIFKFNFIILFSFVFMPVSDNVLMFHNGF